ncbi:hypothetical protein [Vulcanisaeta distributa]|uniref:hypothetical protein n=1 Tax=Vulcanisaeta distributa TaxID=164451 RepID=UPI000A7D8B26|nr:hypothetical protein [Vulcanisaeta distributa]
MRLLITPPSRHWLGLSTRGTSGGGVRLYAIVEDENARETLERVLRGSFHELRRRVKVILLSELSGLVRDLRNHGELVREFVMLDKD